MIDNRFPREARLCSAAEFNHVYQQPDKCVSASFVVLYRQNSMNHPRLGLSISKRNITQSVERNWLKRQLREHFRQHCQRLESVDMIWLTRVAIKHKDRPQIQREINRLWQQLPDMLKP